MTGLVRRAVTRYYRGVPLAEALKNFHTHIHGGREVVYICTTCESPRIRDNHLNGDLFEDSAPMTAFTCLDCATDHADDSTLRVVGRAEFESEVIENHAEDYE